MRTWHIFLSAIFCTLIVSCDLSLGPQTTPQSAPPVFAPSSRPSTPQTPSSWPSSTPSPNFTNPDPFEPQTIPLSEPAHSFEGADLTRAERAYITDINTIIAEVAQPMSLEEMSQLFAMAGGAPAMSKFILFGERHGEYNTLLLKARALHNLASVGDLILFEGHNAGKEWDCMDIIRDLYVAIAYKRDENLPYDPKLYDLVGSRYTPLYLKTKPYLDLNKVSFANADCAFWDNLSAFDLKPKARSLAARNASMVSEASRRHLGGRYNHIFIIAGAFHMPSGDLDRFRDDFARYPGVMAVAFNVATDAVPSLRHAQYYKVLRASTSAQAQLEVDLNGYGTTEEIFEYMKSKDFSEMIPAAILNATEPCGPACD